MLRKFMPVLSFAVTSFASPVFGATTPNSFVTPQTPNRGYYAFSSSSAQNTWEVVYTAGSNGSRCYSMTATDNDPNYGHQISWRIYNGTNIITSYTVNIPQNLGYLGAAQPLITPAITTGLPVDQYGNQYIQLVSGDTIQVAYNGSLGSGVGIFIYAICSDY
jgi:hypothetical protein